MVALARSGHRRAVAIAGVAAAMLTACEGQDSLEGGAGGTVIQVSNETFGDPIERDGYTVTVDGAERRLGVNASTAFADLEPGAHTVALSGVERDCAVLGVNPRTVETTAGPASSVFLVRCSVAGTGRIIVQSFTYGTDPDGYVVTIDGGRLLKLDAIDEDVFPAVPVGPVTLRLSGQAAGCVVTAPNPRTLQLREHDERRSIFKVHCPD
jgi:hypothetical protein